MIKKVFVAILMIFIVQSCEKGTKENFTNSDSLETSNSLKDSLRNEYVANSDTQEPLDSVGDEQEENVSNEQIIENILFQKKIKFLPVYISKDEFGNKYYGFSVVNGRDENSDDKFNYHNGKFQKNNVFMELDYINRMISQKYTFDISQRKLTIHDRKYDSDNELKDGDVLNMHMFLYECGILCIDRDIKPTSKYGKRCGIFIADNLDDEIIANYPKVILEEFKKVNN